MQNTATAWQLLDSLTIIYIETLSYFKVKPVTAMFIIFSDDGKLRIDLNSPPLSLNPKAKAAHDKIC